MSVVINIQALPPSAHVADATANDKHQAATKCEQQCVLQSTAL
jgi:hypothetical protein